MCVCTVNEGSLFLISQVGQLLRKATAGTGVKLSFELGGKSLFIVYESRLTLTLQLKALLMQCGSIKGR